MATEDDYDDDFDEPKAGKIRNKSRRELPSGAVTILKNWLLSPAHFNHPYPTPQDQTMLMQQTGIDKKQLKNWFTNARRRIWKPMLKKKIEEGKHVGLPGVGGLSVNALPGAATNMDNPHSVQAMRNHYQQAVEEHQKPQVRITHDPIENICNQNSLCSQIAKETYSETSNSGQNDQYYGSHPNGMTASSSIGTLPPISSATQLSKTDSHAVLMELFARDQDLVRQATESARLKAESKQNDQAQTSVSNQHPMKAPPQQQGTIPNVPTLNSWPHFSSINSLNNLGTIPGVKSISSLSGTDLASKGIVNRMGNLAQVKSVESMGRNDSYAFLEVFFDQRSSTNLSGMNRDTRGVTGRPSENEDNEIGLSLEDDSSPTQPTKSVIDSSPVSNLNSIPTTESIDTNAGNLKRSYDDALAARGLISVSRSSENLLGLELPAKMQKTLSEANFAKKQSVPGQDHGGAHVSVPPDTACAICSKSNVDTQLRPCGHMFHEHCLKPSWCLNKPSDGAPRCPIDNRVMESAVLAIPTEGTPAIHTNGLNHSNSMKEIANI